MKSKREQYIELCTRHPIPIFSQWFWLDAICGENEWNVIIVKENDKVLATLPYMIEEKNGNRIIQKLPLTQNNGIYIYYTENQKKNEKKISFEMKVINLILSEIKKLNLKSFRQYFHYSFTNWLPFYWEGYSQTTRYTYVIDASLDLEVIVKNFNGNIRTALNKTKKIGLSVEKNLDFSLFYSLVKKTYLRQKMEVPFSEELFLKLSNKLKENNSIRILYAIDNKKNIHSAVLFVEDKESIYYLISGSDEMYRDSQSLTLLIYEGILLAHKKNKKFDFEGSMKKNIEFFFRQFGAEQKMYFDISKNFY